MNDEANKLLDLINKYTGYCQKASLNFYSNAPYVEDRTEAIESQKSWDVLKKEIQTLCQYKEDAEKWRAHVERTEFLIHKLKKEAELIDLENATDCTEYK